MSTFMTDPTPSPRTITLAHDPFHGVLDLATGLSLTLHEFIGEGDYGDLVEKRRLALEHDLIEDRVRFVCQKCHKAMVLRSLAVDKYQEDRFYLKHRFRSEQCGGVRNMKHDAICAMKYANTKEGKDHKDYKALIEASLDADPSFSETKPEKAWFSQD
ncbi:MAG: hypothetical protein ABIO75_07275, partial [Thermomonas sp.]